MMSREVSPRTYPEIGISDPHHGLSHHQNNPASMAKLAKINRFHIEQLAYFLEQAAVDARRRRHAARSRDAALRLRHQRQQPARARQPADPRRSAARRDRRGGRHLRCDKDTPLTNLQLTLLDRVGVPLDKLGDSTGRIGLVDGV